MIKAILFDLDGTLADSLKDLADATNYAIGTFGYPAREVEQYKYYAGDGMPKMIERALPDIPDKQQVVQAVLPVFLKYYGEHYCDNTLPYRGAVELIDALRLRGLKVTAALIAMDMLGVKPEECVFVGDSKMDVMTGVNSGAYPVGVLWGFRERSELTDGGAKSIISAPEELLDIIGGLR